MAGADIKPGRVDRQLTGEPITIGSRTVQPVASVTGWAGGGGDGNGGGGGGFVSITPLEVVVRDDTGREQHIPTPDATNAALRGILIAGLAGPLIWLIVRLIMRRSSNGR
ncbi:MAG: hypothetical protein U0822_01370 [Anaerolineae bacterium]